MVVRLDRLELNPDSHGMMVDHFIYFFIYSVD